MMNSIVSHGLCLFKWSSYSLKQPLNCILYTIQFVLSCAHDYSSLCVRRALSTHSLRDCARSMLLKALLFRYMYVVIGCMCMRLLSTGDMMAAVLHASMHLLARYKVCYSLFRGNVNEWHSTHKLYGSWSCQLCSGSCGYHRDKGVHLWLCLTYCTGTSTLLLCLLSHSLLHPLTLSLSLTTMSSGLHHCLVS